MSKKQKIINACLLIISSLFLFLSLSISGMFSFYEGSFYLTSLPYISIMTTMVIVSVFVIIGTSASKQKLLIFNIWLLLLSVLLAFFALQNWPGDDDGPGMAWFILIVCIGSVTNIVSSLLFFVLLRSDIKTGKNIA